MITSARMDSPPRARIVRRSSARIALPAGASPIGRVFPRVSRGHCPVSSGLPRTMTTFPPMLDLPRRESAGGFSGTWNVIATTSNRLTGA